MTTSIAEYYLDELYDWRSAIDLYIEGIDDSEEWLKSLLLFNSVPRLAANVEHHLNQLLLSKEKLLHVKSSIEATEHKLYKDQAPVGNKSITENLKIQHKQLREEMHKAEKEFLDIKYNCDEFLAGAVDIQNRIKNN